ncbi:MAG: S8 family serine peptidase [Xanthomonadaceae bacterium]|nr:S8 family serine peptidase [Xanthomonadaceae bacterium]
MKNYMKLIGLFSLLLSITSNSYAVPIAVIDSGTDFEHPDLKANAWINPGDQADDGKDNEHNGKTDDIHGWNFAENNKKLIERSLLGTFSPDVYKYFDVQFKKMAGTATVEDIDWMKARRQDAKFIEEMNIYGNFMHGTHVAGISSHNAPKNEIMAIKLLPTVVKKPKGDKAVLDWANKFKFPVSSLLTGLGKGLSPQMIDMIIKQGLKSLAGAQSEMLIPVGRYVRLSGAKVANCSFGSSPRMIQMLLGQLFKAIFKKDMPEKELRTYTSFFMKELSEQGRKFSVIATKTLFVIAAGNDAENNDEMPSYPAGIRRHNAITVAATFGVSQLAEFSNYGKNTVEVAAPGVAILSSEPGTGHVRVSGTSQAAPFVTNVAGRILDQNPALTPEEVKSVLMGTVDFKESLKDKVVSGGVVNPERAVLAAELSRGMNLTDAMNKARLNVMDVAETMILPQVKKPGEHVVQASELMIPQFIRYE